MEKHKIRITKEGFGDKWPFTVIAGWLENRNGAVIFHVDGKEYAVNGIAISRGFADIDEIWRVDPNLEGLFGEDHTEKPKMDMSPIIQKGHEL